MGYRRKQADSSSDSGDPDANDNKRVHLMSEEKEQRQRDDIVLMWERPLNPVGAGWWTQRSEDSVSENGDTSSNAPASDDYPDTTPGMPELVANLLALAQESGVAIDESTLLACAYPYRAPPPLSRIGVEMRDANGFVLFDATDDEPVAFVLCWKVGARALELTPLVVRRDVRYVLAVKQKLLDMCEQHARADGRRVLLAYADECRDARARFAWLALGFRAGKHADTAVMTRDVRPNDDNETVAVQPIG